MLDFKVKEEPSDPNEDLAIAMHSITATDEIVLNISSPHDVIDMIKTELVDDEPDEEEIIDPVQSDLPTIIVPWPAFVPVASHPELAGRRRKRKSAATTAAAAASSCSPSVSGAEKRSRGQLEDVTALYSEEDMDENKVRIFPRSIPLSRSLHFLGKRGAG